MGTHGPHGQMGVHPMISLALAPIHLWAPRANNTIIMLNSRKGGHAGGCLPLLSSRTRSQQAVLHCCARNKQCYTAVLLPKHYTTRKQCIIFLSIVLHKSLAQVLTMRQQRPEVPGALRAHPIATSNATPLCSQQAVLHRCAFAKTLHNTKANAE
jgi:hypothetical protein